MNKLAWSDIRELVYEQIMGYLKWFMYEPNNTEVRQNIQLGISCFLSPLEKLGILNKYQVFCSATNNTDETLDRGELHVDFGWKVNESDEYTVVHFMVGPDGLRVK